MTRGCTCSWKPASCLATREGVPQFELHAAGYLSPGDRRYLRDIRAARVRAAPCADAFRYHGELSRADKISFFQSLDVFSTPTVYPESKGLPVLEAWANGVPAVLPAHGTYPELAASTGGGLLHRPLDAADLADKLGELLTDPSRAEAMGRAAQAVVQARYTADAMAAQTLDLYGALAAARGPAKGTPVKSQLA